MRSRLVRLARPLLAVWVMMLVAGCATRRFYPLMTFHPEERPNQRLDLGAVALLSSGLVVVMNEVDSSVLYEVAPHAGLGELLHSIDRRGDSYEDLFQLTDSSQECPGEPHELAFNRCRNREYRAYVRLAPRAITWLPAADGRVVVPEKVEDLSPFPCPAHDPSCEARVLGVTEFSTIGRITSFREDAIPRSREQLERVFVLERREGAWREVRVPEIEVLRQRLSDWGRANCEVDFVVEGIAYDPHAQTVYLGVNRCQGTAQKVLSYSLRAARAGVTANLDVVAEGIRDRRGVPIAGVSEGLSSLDFAHGQLWATSSWDDYGYATERKYGGRLLVMQDNALRTVPLPGPLRDRSDGLVVLPNAAMPEHVRDAAEPDAIFPYLTALVLFDNDYGQRRRPNGTVVAATTPAPPATRQAALMQLTASPLGSLPIGLNSFDFRWFLRDHRLGTLGVIAGDQVRGSGAWTTALGGLWQVRLGLAGRGLRWLTGKGVGHNRQAAGVTSYQNVPELQFTGYRAVISVVPGERTAEEVSVARVLDETRRQYEVSGRLPRAAAPGAGLVLQGFTIDTSPRASGGICLAAMDIDVAWTDPQVRDRVTLRAALLGGLCNDFNSRDPDEFHGLTTNADAGVKVNLYFAVVEGAEARRGTVLAAQRDLPGARVEGGATSIPRAGRDMPPPPAYVGPDAPFEIGNLPSKDNLACVLIDAANDHAEALPFGPHRNAPAPDQVAWLYDTRGALPTGPDPHRGGSLSGFAFALDLRGFDPALYPDAYRDVTEVYARNQNVYIYRYLLRAWLHDDAKVLLEGGMSHGLHVGGFGLDNAMPTAMLVRADLTWWDGLSAPPLAREWSENAVPRLDPNLQPEDGYLRWSHTTPRQGAPSCSPR